MSLKRNKRLNLQKNQNHRHLMLVNIHIYSKRVNSSFNYCLMMIFFIAIACKKPAPTNSADTYIITDDLGRKVAVPVAPKKIISLAPSMTEILFAVCDEDKIVARTQNCNYPELVKGKPVLNNYPLDYESLVMYGPDLVFAVDGITNVADIKRMEELGIPVVVKKFQTVEGTFKNIEEIGALVGQTERGKYVADSLRKELNALLDFDKSSSFQVLGIIWTDPIFAFGYYSIMNDKFRLLNVVNVVDDHYKKESPELSVEYILKKDPDVIVGTTKEKLLKAYPQFAYLKCVSSSKIHDLSDDLQSRPGPRIVEAIRELKQKIYAN
jgi:iron complex transport system substrate-binding protein